jgi:glycosyltransferase involved in cell wall biosynthesis
MHNEPLVSVVIPTYNRTHQTFAAVESVLAQTYRHLEVIVVDDGSNDGSREVVKQFADKKVSQGYRVIFLSQPNRGAGNARNTGIAKARGEYVAFLDSDDVWFPSKLEIQLRVLDQLENCGACFTDVRLTNDAGMDVSSFLVHARHYSESIGIDYDATKSLARSFCGLCLSAMLVKTEMIRQIGGFDANILFAEDRDLLFRLSLVTSIGYINECLVRSNRTPSPPGSICRPWDTHEFQFRHEQFMLEKWLTLGPALPINIHILVRRSLGALHSSQTNWHLENSRYAQARKAVSCAVLRNTTPGTIAKFLLTWIVPSFAKQICPKIRPIGTGGHAS